MKSVLRGRIRSLRKNATRPKIMKPNLAGTRSSGRYLRIMLVAPSGKRVTKSMAVLMADTFIGPRPDGYVVCIKNNDPTDVRLQNLSVMQRSTVTKLKTPRPKTIRKKLPVVKINKELEVVDAFPSVRQAALNDGINPKTLQWYVDRKSKRTVFAPNGYLYCWDDSRSIWASLRRAMMELDAQGLRYNNPFTGKYFDLPIDEGLDIDLMTIPWSQVLCVGGVIPLDVHKKPLCAATQRGRETRNRKQKNPCLKGIIPPYRQGRNGKVEKYERKLV